MIEFWESLAYCTKFSVVAFVATGALGLFSMGFLGLGLYYTVSVLFKSYPKIKDWHGDWTWPSMIGVGIGWSIGFIIAGVILHYIKPFIHSDFPLIFIYLFILWIWAAILWYFPIKSNLKK